MRVTEKGQVTIPKPIRDKLGIVPGSEVEFVERDELVVVERRAVPGDEAAQSFDDWASSVAGKFDYRGMDGKEFVDWLRGPREDLDDR